MSTETPPPIVRFSSLRIADFRGFFAPQEIQFAIPSGNPGSGLTVIVGPNNSGKTTIIQAMKRFMAGNPPQFDREERHPGASVEIVAMDSLGRTKSLTTSGSAIGTFSGDGQFPRPENLYIVSSRRYWAEYFGSDPVDRSNHRNHLFRVGREGRDGNFGPRMIDIERTPEKKVRFDSIIKQLVPHFTEWHIELSRGQSYINYITGKNDQHSSEYFGDGITSLFKIAAALTDFDESEVLVIDEPELSLHPQAQKRLARFLANESGNRQIVVTTHSPLFVRWEDLAKGARLIRLNKPEDKACSVYMLKETTVAGLKNFADDWQKPHILDTAAKEVFFANDVVFVEGQEDMSLITRFIEDEGIETGFEIFGYGSGGSGNIKYLMAMAEDLGLRSGAIFDGKEERNKAECHSLFTSACIRSISTPDIRDKKQKGVVGLFNEDGTLKPEHRQELRGIIADLATYFQNKQ